MGSGNVPLNALKPGHVVHIRDSEELLLVLGHHAVGGGVHTLPLSLAANLRAQIDRVEVYIQNPAVNAQSLTYMWTAIRGAVQATGRIITGTYATGEPEFVCITDIPPEFYEVLARKIAVYS